MNRPPYSLVIFDFDGTLADSGPWLTGVLREMAVKHRFRQVDDAEIERLRGLRTREVIRELGISMWQLPAIARDVRRLATEAAASIPLFAGVAELLETLAANGVVVAVVTSNAETTVRAVLGAHARHVAHFACGSSLFGKAAKLSRLVRELGVPATEVLCVGDETRDIEAAREAGLRIAAVTWGYATAAALRKAAPDALVSQVAELAQLVCA